jgi:4a-hydroxytetrahydrobiopterin dehydratase
MSILTDAQIEQHLAQRPHWRRRGDVVFRELSFRDFDEAVAFVCRLPRAIERRDPHPEIVMHDWNGVRLVVAHENHAGITSAAFEIADQLDAAAAAFQADTVAER